MPKRDFPKLLTAFLAAAATGAAIGGAKEAKAQFHEAGLVICDDDFCQFFENEPFDQFVETLPFEQFFSENGPTPFFEDFFQVVEPLPPIVPIGPIGPFQRF